MSVSSFIARRLYSQHDGEARVSRPAMIVAAMGVAVGVAVMLITISVALGFKHEIRSKVLSVHGDIQVLNYHSLTSQESQPVLIDDSVMLAVGRCPGVVGMQRFVSKAGMFKTPTSFHGVMLVGTEGGDSVFAVSKTLAADLQVQPGDRLNAYFFEKTIRARRFTIDSLYATHMEQFDNLMVWADYNMIHRLTGWKQDECSGLRIFIADGYNARDVAYTVSQALRPYSLDREMAVLTAEELTPQIFAWLSLLDTNVWIILALMLCVAAFTMVAGLLTLILERTQFVSLMKALGASNSLVHRIFLKLATLLLLRAMVWAYVAGLGLLWLQKTWHIISLNPSEYYIDTVPVEFHWPYFIAVGVGTLIVSVAALLLPATFVSHIRPASGMRIE